MDDILEEEANEREIRRIRRAQLYRTSTNQSHEPERVAESAETYTVGDYACDNCNWISSDTSRPLGRGISVGCPICQYQARLVRTREMPVKYTEQNHFDTLWSTAPRSRTARIEREDAEWWFNQNSKGENNGTSK